MHSRIAQIAAGISGALLVLALAALVLHVGDSDTGVAPPPPREPTRAQLRNPPGILDRLVLIDTAAAFAAGKVDRTTVLSAGEAGITLSDERPKGWPLEGMWTSPEMTPEFPITNLLPSWNVLTPPETGVQVDARARDVSTGQWTDWLYMGAWGREAYESERKFTSGAASIDVDEMILSRPASAYQVRVRLFNFDLENRALTPRVRRIAVSYSGVPRGGGAALDQLPIDGWARDLNVPFRAQVDPKLPLPLRGKICSPTSVSMVLQHWGIDRPTVANAMAIYDSNYEMFGNWNRAVQYAGQFGLDAWLTRYRTWQQVKGEIARGQPVIASIRFKRGTFPSNVNNSSDGHLLVIRGMTADGNLIVNDPASLERGNGVIYRADEFARAWFDNGGVGYVIRQPTTQATASR
jgi:hypothetical protein